MHLKNDDTEELKRLLEKVNPSDPLAAAKAYPRVMAALRWYIENDDTNLGDPENKYWEINYHRGKKVYEVASGGVKLNENYDAGDHFRLTIHDR